MTTDPVSSEGLWQNEFSQVDAEISKKAIDEVMTELIRKFTAAGTGQAPQ